MKPVVTILACLFFSFPGRFEGQFFGSDEMSHPVKAKIVRVVALESGETGIFQVTVERHNLRFHLFTRKIREANSALLSPPTEECEPNMYEKGTKFRAAFGLEATAIGDVYTRENGCKSIDGIVFCARTKPTKKVETKVCANRDAWRKADTCSLENGDKLMLTIRAEKIVRIRKKTGENKCLSKLFQYKPVDGDSENIAVYRSKR